MPIATSSVRRSLARWSAIASLSLVAIVPAHAWGDDGGSRGGHAGSSGEAARPSGGRAAGATVGPTIPGLDVSHWQGTIDWAKVAGAGKRFVFLKATDGHDYVDPTFATNRAGARANGLLVGAYHFARPDPSTGDAAREARWFVNQADPEAGNLLPVLDIETSGGLDQSEMTAWALRWVAEVRERTGVTPLVYTSPYGWLTRFGDTRRLARDGTPLWVAHWGVSSPTLPADEWDGHGWVVWQHTSTGHVAGIAGNVDLDRVAGTTLDRITIRRLSLTVEGDAGSVASSPAGLGCRTVCTKNVHPDTIVTLTAVPDENAYFTGWDGACTGTDPTCGVTMRGNRNVTASFVTDITPPTASIESPADFTDAAVVGFDEATRGVSRANIVLRPVGGMRLDVNRSCRSRAGAVPCDATNVRSVALTPRQPLVPGRDYVVVVNPAGVSPRVRDRIGNPAPTTRHGFEAARGVEQDHAPVARKPGRAWRTVRAARASAGSFVVADLAGAAVTLRFDGVGVDWTTVTGPNRGLVRVYIDGERVRTVDLYAPTRIFGVVRRVDGLADGPHKLRIEVTGNARPAAADSLVAIDRFDVLG